MSGWKLIQSKDWDVRKIICHTSGQLWVTASDGIISIDPSTSTHRVYTEQDGLPQAGIAGITEDKTGQIWALSRDASIYVLREDRWHVIETSKPVDGRGVDIIADDECRIWCGINSYGIVMYQDGRWYRWTTENGLPNDAIVSLSHGKKGKVVLWIATFKGPVRYNDNAFLSFHLRHAVARERVLSILETSSGEVLFGTQQKGITCFKNGKFTHIKIVDGLAGDTVNALVEDAKGYVFAASYAGGLSIRSNDVWQRFAFNDGQDEDYIFNCLAIDKESKFLYAGTNRGIWQYCLED
jgi:ligand-binding sensor domain-containing protein